MLTTEARTEERPKIEIVPQIAHTDAVWSVAFSPDATLVLSGSYDHTVKLWDAITGALLRTFEGHNGAVASVAFSPDGIRMLSGSADHTLKLWAVSTGRLLQTFEGHDADVTSVAFSLDGTRALSGSYDDTVKLWDTVTGKQIRTFLGHSGPVWSVAFSPDGNRILSGSSDNTIKLWDVSTGALLRTFQGHSKGVTSVAFSPDGSRVLSGSLDETIKLWDASTGVLIRSFEGHSGRVSSVAFSADGKSVVSGNGDNSSKLWDVAKGELLTTFHGHTERVNGVAFSPDGSSILSGSGDHTVKLWNATTGALVRTFEGRSIKIASVAFSPDGERVLSGSDDHAVKEWDAGTGALLGTFVHSDIVTSVAFSSDGTRALSGSADDTLKLWDAVNGALIRTFKGHSGGVFSVAFSPDGGRVLSGSHDQTMRLWDAGTGQLLHTFVGHQGRVASVAFSPDGAHVLSGSFDETVKLWDVGTGQLLHTFEGRAGSVEAVAFSPDGIHFASGSTDNTVKIWDATTGALIRSLVGHSGEVTSVAYSPTGDRVLSASDDHTLKLWDASTGTLLRTFEGHSAAVASSAFSPDGRRLLSGGADSTIRIWNTEFIDQSKSKWLTTLIATRGGDWLAIMPSGFFAASSDATESLVVVRGSQSFSVKQFYDHLYRPDLVEQLLKGDPEGKYADAVSKLDLEKILDSGPAPQIEQPPERKTELIGDTAKVTVRLTDTGGGIGEKLVWRVNGVTQGDVQGATSPCTTSSSCRIATQTLRLDPTKKSVIEVTAYNGAGLLATEPYRIEIDKFGVTMEERPHMFVVAVGVSEYAKSEWHLKYAANDAQIVGDTLKFVARGLYGEPKVVPVLDKNATAKGIEAAIDSLKSEVKPSDVFVLYVAGHGRSIAGTYYFLPQDLQFEGGQTIMSGGISQDMLQKWLAKIPAQKSILILDTCESAAARGGDVEQETAIDRLQHATGRSVITAASSSAFEGYQGHGLLTYTILDELTKPEGGGNEEVTLSKLAAYVYDQVPKISQRVFGERQQPHNTVADDFPLGERVAMANAATAATGQVEIPKTPTHVLIRPERVRQQPSSSQGERVLAVGTLVRMVQPSQGWALIARDGEKLGYVPEDALVPIQ